MDFVHLLKNSSLCQRPTCEMMVMVEEEDMFRPILTGPSASTGATTPVKVDQEKNDLLLAVLCCHLLVNLS
jgi:hypothetical protein